MSAGLAIEHMTLRGPAGMARGIEQPPTLRRFPSLLLSTAGPAAVAGAQDAQRVSSSSAASLRSASVPQQPQRQRPSCAVQLLPNPATAASVLQMQRAAASPSASPKAGAAAAAAGPPTGFATGMRRSASTMSVGAAAGRGAAPQPQQPSGASVMLRSASTMPAGSATYQPQAAAHHQPHAAGLVRQHSAPPTTFAKQQTHVRGANGAPQVCKKNAIPPSLDEKSKKKTKINK